MTRLLIAHDLSNGADRALCRAVSLARARNAELVVLHVVKGDLPREIDDKVRAEAADWIGRRIEDLAIDLPVRVEIDAGPRAAAIARRADGEDAALIVVGAYQPTWVEEFFTGSTIERLARHGGRPLLIVKRRTGIAEPDYGGALFPTDLSAASARAAQAAIELFPDLKLTVLRVLDLPTSALGAVTTLPPDTAEAEAEARAFMSALGLLRATASVVVRLGSPASVIADFATSMAWDLVVMGSAGRGALAHRFLGSVATDSLGRLTRDALVVPENWEQKINA